MIRLHWGIENKLHWVLDVAFSEDASRKRAGSAAQNFSILSKIALNLLRQDKQTKQGLKGKRLKAAYDNNYLIKILGIKV
jgi:predicted transposase YbfD/YdcC